MKTNIGHLEAAAGVASLIKVVLGLHYHEIPPHLHLKSVNPHINLAGTPFLIPTTAAPWPAINSQRRAGVSSFGFTGTNAHVVIEEAHVPAPEGPSAERPWHVLCLSARTELALRELATRYVSNLAEQVSLADVAFTANVGRAKFRHRLAVVAQTTREAVDELAAFIRGRPAAGLTLGNVYSGNPPAVTFLFRGESLPHANRGRLLFDTQPTFRRALEQCHELLRSRVSRSLLVELYGDSKTPSPLSEPALFALEYAMARLWQSWGIEPMAVAGHRVGQFAAACIAGVLSVADALRLTVDGVDQADGVQFSQPQVRFLGLR